VLHCDYLAHNAAHNLLLSFVALQDSDGASAVDRLFGLKLHTKLKCEETGEEMQVRVWLQLKLKPHHMFAGPAVAQCSRGFTVQSTAVVPGCFADVCCAMRQHLQQDSTLHAPARSIEWSTVCYLTLSAGGQHGVHAQVQHQCGHASTASTYCFVM
jgi:hypothetical protein